MNKKIKLYLIAPIIGGLLMVCMQTTNLYGYKGEIMLYGIKWNKAELLMCQFIMTYIMILLSNLITQVIFKEEKNEKAKSIPR